MNALLADPWVSRQIDAALEPYAGRMSKAELCWMREQLAEVLSSDDHAALVLRRAHPREVEQSGEVGYEPIEDSVRHRGMVG
jgi:hypothetical protein